LKRPADVLLQGGHRRLSTPSEDVIENRQMVGEHRLDLIRTMLSGKGRMRRDQRQLISPNGLAQLSIGAAENGFYVELDLQPLELGGPSLAPKLCFFDVLAARGNNRVAQGFHCLSERRRLKKPSHLEMIAEAIGSKRPGVPTLVRMLLDQPGPLELGEHLVSDGPARAVVGRERAFGEQETPIRQARSNGVLNLGIDLAMTIAEREAGRDSGRQAKSWFNEVAPTRRAGGLADEVTEAFDVPCQSVTCEALESGGNRRAARPKSAGNRRLA
jgi:hypothetical protein